MRAAAFDRALARIASQVAAGGGGCVGPRGPAGTAGADAFLGAYAVGSEPAAAAGNVWRIIAVTQASQPTLVKMCVTNSAGGYEWTVIGQST